MKKKVLLFLLCPLLLVSCNGGNKTSVASNTVISEKVNQIEVKEKKLNYYMSIEMFMDTLFGETFTIKESDYKLHVYEKKEENNKLLYEDVIDFISINSKSEDHHSLKDMSKEYLNYYKRNCVSNDSYNYSENVEQIHIEQNTVTSLSPQFEGEVNQYYYLDGKKFL